MGSRHPTRPFGETFRDDPTSCVSRWRHRSVRVRSTRGSCSPSPAREWPPRRRGVRRSLRVSGRAGVNRLHRAAPRSRGLQGFPPSVCPYDPAGFPTTPPLLSWRSSPPGPVLRAAVRWFVLPDTARTRCSSGAGSPSWHCESSGARRRSRLAAFKVRQLHVQARRFHDEPALMGFATFLSRTHPEGRGQEG